MAKKDSFNEKTVEELKKLLGERREELRQIRFAGTGARTKNTSSAAAVRKDIARALTFMTQKEKVQPEEAAA